jgi:hypothetical protein
MSEKKENPRELINKEIEKVDELNSQLQDLLNKRTGIEEKHAKAVKLLEKKFEKKLKDTQEEYERLSKASERLDLLMIVKDSYPKPVGILAGGKYDRHIEEKDKVVIKAQRYKQSLVICAISKDSICKDDSNGDGGYDCEWEIDSNQTCWRREDDDEDTNFNNCKDMNTVLIENELEDQDQFLKEIEFVEVDGDHHGMYAYGEAVKSIILLTWIPEA